MQVTIVDYGMGNLLSVRRAFEYCGAQVLLSGTARDVARAGCLVLPGVGAFGHGMCELRRREYDRALKDAVHDGAFVLGICLGMQMMMDASAEFGWHEGLALVPGTVRPIPRTDVRERLHKVPHIGWNKLVPAEGGPSWPGSILSGSSPEPYVYFVHSFAAVPMDASHRLADTVYGGRRICAAIQSQRLSGCQFHPEKSGEVGLAIITSFLRLVRETGVY